MQTYIPAAVTSVPTAKDLEKPLPDVKWSKEDSLCQDQDLNEVQTDFHLRLIEVSGFFNYGGGRDLCH